MESKKINQLATELAPDLSDITIIGDPTTGISKKITLSQMASLFTGTVEEYANFAAFPLVGVADTIYIAKDTNVIYRWDSTAYVVLSPNVIASLVFNDANGFDGTIALVGSVATLTITTALTSGSVPFIGASGALTQDNANLFFDDTNNRLGIATASPTTPLDVFGSGIIGRLNATSTNNAYLGFASNGTNKWSAGNVQSDHRFRIFSEANSAELITILQTGEFGIGIANPTTKFHIDGAASALIANLDANVSVAKTLSFRSDNSNRINLEVSGTESGTNAGANFFIRRYSDAGALIDTPLTITRSTGNLFAVNSLSIGDSDIRNTKLLLYGAGAAGTPQFMLVNSSASTLQREFYADSSGNLIFSYWDASSRTNHLTIASSGAATFINDITITKASSASFIANNTSASGKSYRLLSADDGTFRIQNTGVLDLVAITSLGLVGIGTNGPEALLHINKSSAGGEGGYLFLDNSAGSTLGNKAGIKFANDTGAGFTGYSTSIESINTNASTGAAALTFSTWNGTSRDERVRITSSGSVGIGINNPLSILDIREGNRTNGSNIPNLGIYTTTGQAADVGGTIGFGGLYNSNSYAPFGSIRGGKENSTSGNYAGYLAFQTIADNSSLAERMRIRSDGNIGIGSVGGSGTRLSIQAASANAAIRIDADSGQSAILIGGNGNINADYPGVSNGRFQLDGNGNVYNRTGVYGTISSDLRLKENIVDASSKLEDILKLRVVNFNLISDIEKKKNIGFIAQELQEVFPSFVYEKDTREYDEEENLISGFEDSLGVKVGMEFAILVKAMQEQQAQIEELKALINK
jgi:hypothetical protein